MRRLHVAVLFLFVASCHCLNPNAHYGTALYLIVNLNGLTVDQLDISISSSPTTIQRPEKADGPLSDPQTLRLLLRDELAGTDVTVTVFGSSGGNVVGSGQGAATVVLGLETVVTVDLAGMSASDGGMTDAGTRCSAENCAGCCDADGKCQLGGANEACGRGGIDCSACAPNNRCTSGACEGCNNTNCPGCCNGSQCVTSPTASFCGADGGPCVQCDGVRANACSAGKCQCQASIQCLAGQLCKSGSCICDPTSCPNGCCDDNGICRTGAGAGKCGFGGEACRNCFDGGRADSCSSTGQCGCGSQAECLPNQRCVASQCVCNAASCTGCCDGTACEGRSETACAPQGLACVGCDPKLADSCAPDGTCRCGAQSMCSPGTECTAMGCRCTPASCPGCCDNGLVCMAGDQPGACGVGGGQCGICSTGSCPGGVCSGQCNATLCNDGCCNGSNCAHNPPFPSCVTDAGLACRLCDKRADHCGAGGSCVCGAATVAQCPVGEYCDAGLCLCDSTTCNGCCNSAGRCLVGDLTACGGNGMACMPCDPLRSNSCTAGGCKCGLNTQCAPGLRCSGGACICDSQSLCNGCCSDGNACVISAGADVTACGFDGGTCGTCDTRKADNCAGGTCHCGNSGPCGPGLHCVSGNCFCDQGSGCTGCCSSITSCVPLAATANNQCGRGGELCFPCTNNNSCSATGVCQCGVGGNACMGTAQCRLNIGGLTGLCL